MAYPPVDTQGTVGGSTSAPRVVRDPDVQTVFAFLFAKGGGRLELPNGRGVQVDHEVYKEGQAEGPWRAQIHLLSRTPSGRFATFAFADISDICNTNNKRTYTEVMELWVRLRKVSESTISSLFVQVFDESAKNRDANKSVTPIWENER